MVDPLGRLVLVMSMYLLINSGETVLEIECVVCCIYLASFNWVAVEWLESNATLVGGQGVLGGQDGHCCRVIIPENLAYAIALLPLQQ